MLFVTISVCLTVLLLAGLGYFALLKVLDRERDIRYDTILQKYQDLDNKYLALRNKVELLRTAKRG